MRQQGNLVFMIAIFSFGFSANEGRKIGLDMRSKDLGSVTLHQDLLPYVGEETENKVINYIYENEKDIEILNRKFRKEISNIDQIMKKRAGRKTRLDGKIRLLKTPQN